MCASKLYTINFEFTQKGQNTKQEKEVIHIFQSFSC